MRAVTILQNKNSNVTSSYELKWWFVRRIEWHFSLPRSQHHKREHQGFLGAFFLSFDLTRIALQCYITNSCDGKIMSNPKTWLSLSGAVGLDVYNLRTALISNCLPKSQKNWFSSVNGTWSILRNKLSDHQINSKVFLEPSKLWNLWWNYYNNNKFDNLETKGLTCVEGCFTPRFLNQSTNHICKDIVLKWSLEILLNFGRCTDPGFTLLMCKVGELIGENKW